MSPARTTQCSFLLAIIALITFSSASHPFSVAEEPNCYSPNPIQFDCASAPTTYEDDVIEGRAGPASTQPNDAFAYTRGQSASVAIDDSENTDNTFTVAWISDIFYGGCLPFKHEGSVSYNKLLMARFNANTNENGIPDECEEENRAAGGNTHVAGSLTDDLTSNPTGPLPDGRGSDQDRGSNQLREEDGALRGTFDEDAAWAEFYEWAAAQCWGPDCESTPREQFDAYVAKLTELGLPVTGVR